MITQLRELTLKADGRYATDTEMAFMNTYLASFERRLAIYQTLQAKESDIINEVEANLKAQDPYLLMRGIEDFSTKWKADTVRVFRLTAMAMLMDDLDRYKERFLFWFQTLMRAFKTQKSCEATYRLLQESVRKHLSDADAALVCPILEINREMLGLE
jgi:hypothetical protein